MPALKNARHERFAQERAKGATIDGAFISAGFKANRSNASRLNSNEHVADRIAELSERAADKAEWTAADRLKVLAEITTATKTADPRAAIAAIAEANKMQGSHAPTKADHLSSDGSMSPPAVIQIVGVAARDDDGAGQAS